MSRKESKLPSLNQLQARHHVGRLKTAPKPKQPQFYRPAHDAGELGENWEDTFKDKKHD